MDRDYWDDLAEMRFRSLLSDRDDQVGRLQTQILDVKAESDRALRYRDTLRASITTFATSLAMPPSCSRVVVASSLPGRLNIKCKGFSGTSECP